MTDDLNAARREAVTSTPEYQSLDSEAKKAINGMMGLLELGVVPPIDMAQTVMMTALGVTLRDHENFMKLADGGIHHVKGTNDLVVLAGGWAFRLTSTMYDADDINMDDLEPM